MMTGNTKITIHMVSSLDGYIAADDGSISWLESNDHFEDGVTLSDEDVEKYLQTIDCYVMGFKTYDQALKLGWPYGKTPVFVLSSRQSNELRDQAIFYNGSLNDLLIEKIYNKYDNVWVVGGPTVVKECLDNNLADKIIVSIMPVLLGSGKAFFENTKGERLQLIDVVAYKNGMVELTYKIKSC